MKKRIASDIDYAREFAVKYPEQAYICRELNALYTLNPDAVPADEIRKRYEARERGDQRKVGIFGYVLFVLFLLLSAAFTGFLIWAYCETT